MTHVRACCCDDDGSISCDLPQPLCLKVTLAGFTKSSCFVDTCGYSEELGMTIFSSNGAESVEGIDGEHFITNGSDTEAFCSVKGFFENSQGERIISIIYERVSINIGLRCTAFPSGEIYDEWHVSSCRVASLRVGGAGCHDGTLFLYNGGDVPLGSTISSSSVVTDCIGGGNKMVNNGTVTIEPVDCDEVPPLNHYLARKCDEPTEVLTVDITDRLNNFNIFTPASGEPYKVTPTRSTGTPTPGVFSRGICESTGGNVLARFCENTSVTITIDPATLGPDDITCLRNKSRFIVTSEPSDSAPVAVVGSIEACDVPGEDPRIARLCFRNQEITYDRAIMPAGSLTCNYAGRRYDLTTEPSSEPTVTVIFSEFTCFNTGICFGITGPDDPRCDLPIYKHCPGCFDGTDIGPPGPFPESPESNAPDESPGLLPFGNIFKRGIKLVTVGKLEGCSRCEKRRVILNRFGDKLGRKMINMLEKMGLM